MTMEGETQVRESEVFTFPVLERMGVLNRRVCTRLKVPAYFNKDSSKAVVGVLWVDFHEPARFSVAETELRGKEDIVALLGLLEPV